MSDCDPRAYVACLSCYNAGKLHGHWLDADEALPDAVREAFELNEDDFAPCGGEEFLCHDLEDFPPNTGEIGITEAAEIGEALREHGSLIGAIMAYHGCDARAAVRIREEHYHGAHESEAAFAEQLADDMGDLASVPDLIRYHIDWEGVARDLFCGDFYSIDHDGETHVFWNR